MMKSYKNVNWMVQNWKRSPSGLRTLRLIFTICLAPISRRIKNDQKIPNLERKDYGLRTCIEKGDFEQSKRVKVKRKWGKSVTYAEEATIMTKLNKETIKRIITIYDEHRKKSGLRINAAKTEVYVVQEKLTQKVHNITT